MRSGVDDPPGMIAFMARPSGMPPPNSTGTRVFCVSGNVETPGNYELPHGTTVRQVIEEAGGGIAGGRP